MNDDIFWKRKLLAFLHDPPDKPYDYSPKHEQRAEHYAEIFGLNKDLWQEYKNSDWSAAAADRFIMPDGKKIHGLGEGVCFTHPLSGERVFYKDDFPDYEEASDIIDNVCVNFSGADISWRERFFLAWRLWMEYAASHKSGKNHNAGKLPYLPADTRNPDSSIWLHNTVTSAIESTRDTSKALRPAFLLFQLGPVQEFIAQARSTRDLWSGSYLLSWLMAHAMKAVSDQIGPDTIIYPNLRGNPLFDWLNRNTLKKACFDTSMNYFDSVTRDNKTAFETLVLTPTLPNRFLAVVPHDFNPKHVEQALINEWEAITAKSAEWLQDKGCPVTKTNRFNSQIKNTWNITWQLWPWQNAKDALDLLKTIPAGKKDNPLHIANQIAQQIPDSNKDTRCYRDNELSSGWAWSAHYQLCQHRLDARRQTREFSAWRGADEQKDSYSGKEETVIDDKWLEAAHSNPETAHLFRNKKEFLGAANLVKRIWHKAYLAQEPICLQRATSSFDSVPAIAAAPWRYNVLAKIAENHETWSTLLAFQEAVEKIPDMPFELPSDKNEKKWFEHIDAGVFQESFIAKTTNNTAVLKSLNDLLKAASAGHPSKYYAVLSLDGDKIGQWLSGEKTPPVKDIITQSAVEYFKEKVKDSNSKDNKTIKWLDSSRPISPSYHLQFSEALSNFGLFCARRIVEHHHGQLIYSGGDDVLAMLPAEEAIDCARGLRMAFQGDTALAKRYPDMFCSAPPGFIQLKEGDWKTGARRPSEPSWPLLVPGKNSTASTDIDPDAPGVATVSAGIAVGHIKEPLQDMVAAARDAENRAKTQYNRNSLAVTIYKRSGEQIRWGTKFTDAPFSLLAFLNRGDTYKPPVDNPGRAMPISGKFPYRICELMRVYEEHPDASEKKTELTDNLHDIAQKEIDWTINQLKAEGNGHGETFRALRELVNNWLDCVHEQRGALSDFYNLFAVEAFIARQGE